MFDLIPFEHRNNDLFRYFDDMERAFFGGNTDIAPCKTDILDEGNRFVLKADLPGFKKEDIHLDIEGDRLTTVSYTHLDVYKRQPMDTISFASAMESSRVFIKAPLPVLTSRRIRSEPAAIFLLIMLEAISGMLLTVAVTSRSA